MIAHHNVSWQMTRFFTTPILKSRLAESGSLKIPEVYKIRPVQLYISWLGIPGIFLNLVSGGSILKTLASWRIHQLPDIVTLNSAMDVAEIDPALFATLQELERQKRRMRHGSPREGAFDRSLFVRSRANLHEQEPMFSPPKAPSRSRSLLDVRNPAQNPPEKCGDLSSGSNRSELDSGRTTRRSREGSDGEQRRLQQEFLNRRAAWYKSCKVKESTSSQSNKPTRRVSCTAPTCSTTAHGVGHLASQERATPCAHMSLMYGFSHTRALRVLNFAVAFLVCALLYYGDFGRW